jgi:hypothetical protein
MLDETIAISKTPLGVVTWEAIRLRYDGGVRANVPLEDRQEWEDVQQLAACDIALTALRELRSEIGAALNPPGQRG